MTPAEVIARANTLYNSTGDSFFPDEEAYDILYDGCMELAVKAYVIEDSFSTSTVAGTRQYAYPTNALAIKRVTYDGKALENIDYREDDKITVWNAADTTQGTPVGFVEWEDTLELRPIPGEVKTLVVYAFCQPQRITSSSTTLEVPTIYHMALVHKLLGAKAAKDKDYPGAAMWEAKWEAAVALAVARMQKKRRANRFKVVTDVDSLPYFGVG